MGENWDFDFGGATDDQMADLADDIAAALNKNGSPRQRGAIINGRTGRVEVPAVGSSKGDSAGKSNRVIDVRPVQVTDPDES